MKLLPLFCIFILLTAAPAQTTPVLPAQHGALPIVTVSAMGDDGLSYAHGTGLIVSAGTDGVVVTSYQLVRKAASLRVKDSLGSSYAPVELLASDARLGIAAIRLTASRVSVPVIGKIPETAESPIFIVALGQGTGANVASGSIQQQRQDGALVVSAAATFEVGGAVLTDKNGAVLGLLSGARENERYFAVPIQTVLQFATTAARMADTGRELQLANERSGPANTVKMDKLANVVRTFYVDSKTSLIERDLMIENIRNVPEFAKLDLVLVEHPREADVRVVVDYVPWTFDYTFKAWDARTTAVIAAGKTTAFNGYLAAPALARGVVHRLLEARQQKSAAQMPK
jgi:hypothetical protein